MADVEYDPYSYEQDADPYPIFAALREQAPAYYNPRLDFWALTRFDDCLAAFVDWQTYSSAQGTVLELMGRLDNPPLMIFQDPPRQTRLRSLVNGVFTPRRIAGLEPRVRALATGYLDELTGLERFDVVECLTAKLPMDVISTLLGIPPGDRDTVRGWSNAILHREPGNPLPPPSGLEAQVHLMQYFQAALDERRARPRDDVMTDLIRAEVPDEDGTPRGLTDPELTGFFNLLATAGNETVTKLLASACYWLWRFPEERRALVEDPGLIPGAVEETLRYDAPSQYQGRVTTRPVTLHGERLPEGARVLIVNAAANRDGRKYPEPDRYDVRRGMDLHLGFGFGRHLCLGAHLARLESRVALEELLRRFPTWEVPEDGMRRMHSSNVRGFSGLVLEV